MTENVIVLQEPTSKLYRLNRGEVPHISKPQKPQTTIYPLISYELVEMLGKLGYPYS